MALKSALMYAGSMQSVWKNISTLAYFVSMKITPQSQKGCNVRASLLPVLPIYTQMVKFSCATASKDKTESSDGSFSRLQLDGEGNRLTVSWKDGSESRFHSVWLRHNCQCGACRQEHSGQKILDPSSVHPDVCIDDVRINGEQVEIQWSGENGGHNGYVPLAFLKANCYAHDSLKIRRQNVTLGPPVKTLPDIHYRELANSTDGVLRWLRQLNESGISLLKEVPTEEHMVKKVAEYTGPVENLIYGESWDVISTPKPINVAYSNVALDFHMDLIYYESPPGLQFLHCLRFDDCVEGGESRFLDVFHVAEQFRLTNPDMFEALTRIPATFQKIHYERDLPVEMKYQRPHIILNQYKEIVAVNWAPAFEGPLAVAEEDVEPYYAAYQAFADAIKTSPDIVEYRLKVGDLVTFNNRRILHARNSFELNEGVRHLKGCYVNIDHFKSQVQVCSRLHGEGQPAKRVGNQDWF